MSIFENHFLNRVLHKTLWVTVLPLCAVWSMVQTAGALGSSTTDPQTTAIQTATELPVEWDGVPLRPLALGEVERRFARHFPGTVTRMTNGRQVLVLRTVHKATRMLHPASDCYRGLGYRIHDEQLEVRPQQQRWRCFVADRAGRSVRVCERIEDAQGQGFTDASSWYWASISGHSVGPWKAVTVATPL